MSLPPPPASIALMPRLASFIPKLSPFSLSLLLLLLPFKGQHGFSKSLALFLHFPLFSFFSPSPSDVSFPAHLPLFVTNKLTAYPSPSLHFYLVSHPHPPARHLSQQSMPFHSGEGTNGIPAEATTPPALPLFCCRDPRFHQVTTTSSHMHVGLVKDAGAL